MKHRTLGKDLRGSAVGLGCMRMSHAYQTDTVAGNQCRDRGSYGFDPGEGTAAEEWLDNAVRFWEKI